MITPIGTFSSLKSNAFTEAHNLFLSIINILVAGVRHKCVLQNCSILGKPYISPSTDRVRNFTNC